MADQKPIDRVWAAATLKKVAVIAAQISSTPEEIRAILNKIVRRDPSVTPQERAMLDAFSTLYSA